MHDKPQTLLKHFYHPSQIYLSCPYEENILSNIAPKGLLVSKRISKWYGIPTEILFGSPAIPVFAVDLSIMPHTCLFTVVLNAQVFPHEK